VHDAGVRDATATGSAAVATDISPRGRQVRIVVMLLVAGLLLYGTVAGNDDKFPFGPFHMYSQFYPPNGVVGSIGVVARNAAGHDVVVTQSDTGVAHGDIEGELTAYESDPARLGDLARAFHQRHPLASPFVEVRLVQKRWQLRNRVVVGQSTVTLAHWQAR
jgi:hypothetical protein